MDLIYQLMNIPSDIAFIGPILWFVVVAFSLWFISGRVKSISANYKQSQECKKNPTGKSSKNKENKNN